MQNIFIKKNNNKNNSNKNSTRKILPKEQILKSIPENAKTEQNNELEKTHMEIRWRIFKFPNIENEIIEMSQKEPEKERLYMNQKGEWIKYSDNNKYNQYLVKQFYHYQEINNL